ncbi:hypothetical protein ABE869_09280 [Enterococcus gilvus]|uniref:hypothetical protein n=1 Tax=Enterococcus gilvus TaxID=160453 RepID=UPI003D6B147E
MANRAPQWRSFLANFGMRSKKAAADVVLHELVVSFKAVPAPNILQHVKIKEAAQWEVYGNDVFRGKTTLKKEEMKRLLVDELCLKDDQVYVVEANAN